MYSVPHPHAQILLLSNEGQPFMRPLWYDFPDDSTATAIEDAFMFGYLTV